jgi:phosphopantothenoylcysteine decarboxylase/phosphopantothenate--cysteine ligase|tara:strand:- start:3970 stop:5163 length:1194 start_codon:yes stop_codon:yes gene_type:complete
MKSLTNKNIILAVSGSIAAYKSPDIVRRLQDLGAEVRVILTDGGAKFITELSLQAISKNKVHSNLWDNEAELSMGHIELAKWADAILIAPASANIISNLSSGKACDLVTSVVLASDCPILVAPSMNQQMYASKALNENLSLLEKRGYVIIKPDYGEQACGDIGLGRLVEATKIAQTVAELYTITKLTGKKVLITLGATIEPIDPVRFLSNYSSGKMGMALVNNCIDAGAIVTVVYGTISTQLNEKCINIKAETAAQMHQSVMENIKEQDIFIACAAVCDYRVKEVSNEKIKRNNSNIKIELIPNNDILADVCKINNRPITIGFAAETEKLIINAKNKLKSKGCDAIILNDVSKDDSGFQSDENEVVIISDKLEINVAKNSKQKIARKIVEIICENFF